LKSSKEREEMKSSRTERKIDCKIIKIVVFYLQNSRQFQEQSFHSRRSFKTRKTIARKLQGTL
jgi:hypothetical protein